jgi:S-adenosyl methyltransferase
MSNLEMPPTENAAPPPGVDTTKASIARVYDAFLGGKDNYEVDREVFQKVLEIAPESPELARDFRTWLIRAVRFLAGPAGIDQFLDLGSGLPSAENTHEAAQRINPEAKVVYVDNDPIVAVHGRAMLEENDRTNFIAADLRRPHEVLNHPVVTENLDFSRPLALMQCATIHHVDDDANPREIMATYIDALPSGSYVGLTHFYDPADGSKYSELARGIETTFRTSSMGTGRFRTREEILSLLDGLELVKPGLVLLADWWPDGPRIKPLPDSGHVALGAVGRKP